MSPKSAVWALLALVAFLAPPAVPGARAAGEAGDGPVLEPSTLRSLSCHWVVPGAAQDFRIETEFRKAGEENWRPGMPLFRVESGANRPEKGEGNKTGEGSVSVPEGSTLFAGSVVLLDPDTEYEIRLKPSSGTAKALKARTKAEPEAPKDAAVFHVVPGPGTGGGDGGSGGGGRGKGKGRKGKGGATKSGLTNQQMTSDAMGLLPWLGEGERPFLPVLAQSTAGRRIHGVGPRSDRSARSAPPPLASFTATRLDSGFNPHLFIPLAASLSTATTGGTGSKEDPFRGLGAAQAAAKPGTVFLLHKGVYEGTFTASKSGEPGKPVVWRSAGDGEAILDGKDAAEARPGRAVSAGDIHDVWFEGLSIRNADYGIVAHRSSRIVVRGCRISGVEYGLTCTNNDNGAVKDFFLADNVLEGPCAWPRSKGIENARGIQITGSGHVITRNRIRGFADAIDTFGSRACYAIDIHQNDIQGMTDDGIETDYSERNVRCFENRLVDVFQGISSQPVYGGPVYIFRNVLYNVGEETFKLHNSPSGVLLYHNTSVKRDMPLKLMTGEKVRNCVTRNNLFVGTASSYAYENTAPMADCDFDYDGFGGGPFGLFLKWNEVRYKTFAEAKAKSPAERHATDLGPESPFASGLAPPTDPERLRDPATIDARLKAGSKAADVGLAIPGLNDGFAGSAPDLGAIEIGTDPPAYGPKPAP